MEQLERLTFRGDGVTLVADTAGLADGQPILFLHGSGQTRQSWGKALGEAARRGYRGVSLDLRGHGESDWSPDGYYDLDVFVEDARHVVAALGAPPVLIGASLGGAIGMLLSAQDPAALRALVLVDITPRIEREGTNEIHAFMASGRAGFASLEEAADAVSAYLPHRARPRDTSGLARNLRQRDDGRFYWHWDPAIMQLGERAERQPDASPLSAAARALTVPTLLMRGGRSRVVTEEGAREFLAMVPHADYADIDGAHHMVAGDANDAFNDAMFAFIARQAGAFAISGD